MRIVVVSILALTVTTLFAQSSEDATEWAPIGAQWHYQLILEPIGPNDVSFVSITSSKDTSIEDRSYRKLDISQGTTSDYVLVRQEGRRLLRFVDGQDVILYDFSLNIGDTFFIKSFVEAFGCTKDFLLVLDTTYSIAINGTTRLKQVFEPSPGLDYGPEIIEGIGSIGNWFLPTCSSAGDQNWLDGFRCYEDEVLGLFQENSIPCDFEGLITSTAEPAFGVLQVFPNPFSDQIKLEFDTDVDPNKLYFILTDIKGVSIREGPINSTTIIDFDHSLPPATIVLLTIYDVSGSPLTTIKLISI